MRVSPLGIFCSRSDPERTAEYARQDAALTHPHPVCLQANSLFTMAIADAISRRKRPQELYDDLKQRAVGMKVEKPLMNAILEAAKSVPADYVHQQGGYSSHFKTRCRSCSMLQLWRKESWIQ